MTMTMTSKVNPYKYRFGPYAPEVYRAPFPYPYRMNMTPQQSIEYCIQELERMFVGDVASDQVAAIVVEPVQGEGGFMVAPPGFYALSKRSVKSITSFSLPMRFSPVSVVPVGCSRSNTTE